MDESTRREYLAAIDEQNRDIQRWKGEKDRLKDYLSYEKKPNLRREYEIKIGHAEANITVAEQKIANLKRQL